MLQKGGVSFAFNSIFIIIKSGGIIPFTAGVPAQGLIWGLLALGVYITYKLLDFADLSVDGSLATGGAVAVMLIRGGMNPWLALIFAFLAGMAAGFVTGILHTALGIPGILASILTQISLYSINLNIMGCSNQAVSVDKYNLVVSLRYVSDSTATKIRVFTTCILFCVVVVAILYWYFGTEQGHAIRATGCNKQMARAQGINTDFHTVLALMISNGLVGLAGGLYAQYQGAADVNMGRGAIVVDLQPLLLVKFCLASSQPVRKWLLHGHYSRSLQARSSIISY